MLEKWYELAKGGKIIMINNNCNYHMYDIELRIANRLHRKMSYTEYLNYLSKCYNCWLK